MRGRFVLVGAVAVVALAGCHGGGGEEPAVTVSPAVRDAYLEQLRAIDPGLAAKPGTAVADGETICSDIAKNLKWDQIEADAETTFGTDAHETDQILSMTQHSLCAAN